MKAAPPGGHAPLRRDGESAYTAMRRRQEGSLRYALWLARITRRRARRRTRGSGVGKTHIQRWAPQDYRTSRVRARSSMTSDPMLRLVYLEALNALYEAGGSLPADPALLADELLLPADEIARCLPILDQLARSGRGRGGLLVEDGRVTNRRVSEDLADEQAFRDVQAGHGRESGRVRRAKAASRNAEATLNPPSPSPLPAPSPTPLPVQEAVGRPVGRDAPANPLVRRQELIDEGNRLLPAIAQVEDLDPTEVLSKASAWKGRGYVRLDIIPDDRLAHTLNALRAWYRRLRGEPARDMPAPAVAPSARAIARAQGLQALVTGNADGTREDES